MFDGAMTYGRVIVISCMCDNLRWMCVTYLGIQVTLGTILPNHELGRLVGLHGSSRELGDFQLVSFTHRRGYVYFERRIRNMAIVEFQANAIVT